MYILNTKKAFDSWSKLPSGILQGNIKDYGNFDECISIEHDSKNETIGKFKGKYCHIQFTPIMTGESPIRKGIEKIMDKDFNVIPAGSMGVCIPEKCSAEMWRQIFNTFAVKLFLRISPDDDNCQVSKDRPYDTIDQMGM